MATQQTRSLARFMMAPSVVLLLVWMIVPLAITLWFSFQQYNPLNPIRDGFVGFSNYALFYSNPAFLQSILNTLTLVVSVLLITVIGGILLALLIDQPMWGQGIVRILVISPFFVMPPVAALVWKNMIMHPQYGVFADIARFFGGAADRLVRAVSADGDHHHRRLAVAALRDADPVDRAAVARR